MGEQSYEPPVPPYGSPERGDLPCPVPMVVYVDNAACCVCDRRRCALDDTGEHCMDRSCSWCLHGCPSPDGCCQDYPAPVLSGQPEATR